MILRYLGIFMLVLGLAACGGDQDADDSAAGDASEVKTPQDFIEKVQDRVFFEFDRYRLLPDAKRVLQIQAAAINNLPSEVEILVEGHCDERGDRQYNYALGERRANTTKKFLISEGVDGSRLRTTSYGKDQPAVLGSGESVWGQNRRAVTVLEYMGQSYKKEPYYKR